METKMKNIYILVIGLFVLISCISKKGVFYQPKSNEFKLKSNKFNYNKLIDTTAVYINKRTASDGVSLYRMIRFSNYGNIYFLNGSLNPITVFDANLANVGIYGKYTTYDRDKIKIEFYNSTYGFFVFWYGSYDNEGIYFEKEGTRKFHDPNTKLGYDKTDSYYTKKPMNIYTELKIPK